MFFIILFLSLIVLVKTISFGLYELKKNNNIIAGISIIIIAVFCTILPNIVIYINGII